MDSHYVPKSYDSWLRVGPLPTPILSAPLLPEHMLRERFAGKVVLVVDDDEINREIGVELLAFAGLKAHIAVDGVDAVQSAERHHFDLILMDVHMPRMDGIEATRRIRQLAHHRDIPIIAVTADDRFDDHTQAAVFGMNDSIAKPIDPDVLYATILKWLSIEQLV